MNSYIITSIPQLLSPPLSPYSMNASLQPQDLCNEALKESLDLMPLLYSPVEQPIQLPQDDILRKQFLDVMNDGVEINNEIVPYPYMIDRLHRIGKSVINKKTKDAKLICVYEMGSDSYEVYWIHPLFLSLQSYQFYKLFNERKYDEDDDLIRIEVPSLEAFRYTLYLLYTGDKSVLDFLESNESLYQGLIENITYLEINI